MKLLILISVLLLTSCASKGPTILPNGELYEARTLLDRVEFGEDETGCIDIRGEVDLNPAPFFSSNAQIILKKSKGEDAPEC